MPTSDSVLPKIGFLIRIFPPSTAMLYPLEFLEIDHVLPILCQQKKEYVLGNLFWPASELICSWLNNFKKIVKYFKKFRKIGDEHVQILL